MSNKQPTSYEISDEELVTRLMRAAGEAGTATSGLCFDISAGFRVANMHFLKGVVLARLKGQKPPYEPGTKVFVSAERGVPAKSYRDPRLSFNENHVVDRVWFVDGSWYLELKKVDGETYYPLYTAAAFAQIKVEEAPTTPI